MQEELSNEIGRRQMLASIGAVAGITATAGCAALREQMRSQTGASHTDSPRSISPPSPDSMVSETDKTDTSANSTTWGTESSLSAELDSLQPAVVTQQSADSIDTESAENTQYLYLNVAVQSGTAPAREALRVRFDGREFEPINRDRRLWRAYNQGNSRYDKENGGGWLLFTLPETGDASDIALMETDGSGEWPIVSSASVNFDGRIESRAPPLSLEWSAPDIVEPDDTPTISFTVTNVGDHDGMFVAALNRSGPSIAMAPIAAIREVIPPGEPTTFEITDTLNVENPGNEDTSDGTPDMRYVLHWTGGSRSQQIQVVGSSN